MTPPRLHRLIAGALALGALAVVYQVVALAPPPGRGAGEPAPGERSGVPPRAQSGGAGSSIIARTARPGAVQAVTLSPALARAYAAAGALQDGRTVDLGELDGPAQGELARAEELLQLDRPVHAPAVSTRLGDGSLLGMPAARAAISGQAAAGPAATAASAIAHQRAGDAPAPDAGASDAPAAEPLSGAAVGTSLVAHGRTPSPIRGDLVKQLIGSDAWVAIPYQPALVNGRPLVIENLSTGEYAISLQGADFGSVRLNGCLVVPGRFYRVSGTARITAQVPVGVHIRPLTAVGSYYQHPLQLPQADG